MFEKKIDLGVFLLFLLMSLQFHLAVGYAEDVQGAAELGRSRQFWCVVDDTGSINLLFRENGDYRAVSFRKARRYLKRLVRQNTKQIARNRKRIRRSSGVTRVALLSELEKLLEAREGLKDESAFVSWCHDGGSTQFSTSQDGPLKVVDSAVPQLNSAASVIGDLLGKITEAIKLGAAVAAKVADRITEVLRDPIASV